MNKKEGNEWVHRVFLGLDKGKIPNYAENRNAAAVIFDRVVELGFEQEWCVALCRSISPTENFGPSQPLMIGDFMRVVAAEPEHWCNAAFMIREHFISQGDQEPVETLADAEEEA